MAAPRPTAERREEIVLAALDAFTEHAWFDVRLDAVARRAGVEVEEVREAFGTREGLYRAALELFATQTVGRAEAELPDGRACDQLRMLCDRAWDTLRTPQFGALYRVAIALKPTAPALGIEFREHFVERWKRLLDAVLARGIASGELRPGAAAAGRIISSSLLLQAIWCTGAEASGPHGPAQRVVPDLLGVVLDGIVAR
jgi:AcrR family transcriptional regulator